ncbi:unnamed protein product [Arctogadus glacialis]
MTIQQAVNLILMPARSLSGWTVRVSYRTSARTAPSASCNSPRVETVQPPTVSATVAPSGAGPRTGGPMLDNPHQLKRPLANPQSQPTHVDTGGPNVNILIYQPPRERLLMQQADKEGTSHWLTVLLSLDET